MNALPHPTSDAAPPAAAPVGPSTAIIMLCARWPDHSEIDATLRLRAFQADGADVELWPLTSGDAKFAEAAFTGPIRRLDAPRQALSGLISALGWPSFTRVLRAAAAASIRSLSIAPLMRFADICAALSARGDPPDFVYAHDGGEALEAARWIAGLSDAPWGFRADGAALHAMSAEAAKDAARGAALVVAPTPDVRSRLIESGVEDNRIALALNAPKSAPLPSAGGCAIPRRGEFEIDLVRFRAIGPLTRDAAIDDLLAALALLPDSLFWRFEHHGGGPERPRLKALAQELRLGKRVRWLGLPADGDASPLLAETDIFLHMSRPSRSGAHCGLPAPLLLAAQARCAIIATRSIDVGAALRDEESAMLLRHGRVEELADTLARLSRDIEARAALGAQAQAAIQALLKKTGNLALKARIDSAVMKR